MEFCPLSLLAVDFNGASHGIHNIFGNGHPQAGPFRLLHPGIIFPDIGLIYFIYEFLGHADACIPYGNMGPDICRAPGGFLLVQGYVNGTFLRGELHCIGQEIQQYLVKSHTVAAHIFRDNVMDQHFKLLLLRPDLGLCNTHNAFQRLP